MLLEMSKWSPVSKAFKVIKKLSGDTFSSISTLSKTSFLCRVARLDTLIWLFSKSLLAPTVLLSKLCFLHSQCHPYYILLSRGPSFGLHVNLSKCEIFWLSGDQDFPKFAPKIQRTVRVCNGVDFLGSPVYGSDAYFINSVSKQVDKILHQQDQLSVLEDPHVELHLLRSCLSSCKLNHVIRTVLLSKFLISCWGLMLAYDIALKLWLPPLFWVWHGYK